VSQPTTAAPGAEPVASVRLDAGNAAALAAQLDGMGRAAEAANVRRAIAAGEVVAIGMPLEKALESAMAMHRGGLASNAEAYYRAVLRAAPDHPRANHFFGVALHQMQRSAEGVEHIRRSLDALGDQPWAWNNYGNVLKEAGRVAEAARAYEKAIALDPAMADAHSNLGAAFMTLKEYRAAESHFVRAIALDPTLAAAHANRFQMQMKLKQFEAAMESMNRAVILSPEINEDSPELFARAHLELGDVDKARDIVAGWLRDEPDNPIAQHMLMICEGGGGQERASDAYVATMFDHFATKFDEQLALVDYCGPESSAAALRALGGADATFGTICDAGCGTGLCGSSLRPMAGRLVGVDLSPGMLGEARARGVYDELVEAELTAFLAGRAGAFDAIVASDALTYFGAIAAFAAAARDALGPGGALIFNVEAAAADAPRAYTLQNHGRYAHRRDYVEQVLRDAGLVLSDMRSEPLRNNNGRPVPFWVVAARRL
jgi:predicted TPR repeat methyltransferase